MDLEYAGVDSKITRTCISYFRIIQPNNFKICTLCYKNCNSMGYDNKRFNWLKDTLRVQIKATQELAETKTTKAEI